MAILAASFSTSIAQEKAAAQAKEKQGKNKGALRIVPATKAFLKTLNDEQKSKAVLEFGSEQRVQWHFIPKPTRKGLPVMEMEGEQKKAAMAVLRSTLSQIGYAKATTIMQLESILLKLEGPERANVRNPEKYYFTVFGKPAQKEKWGLSIEGHHLSLNFTLEGGKIIDSTPQFFATNPATLQADFGEDFPKGLQVLKSEEQLGFRLAKSLDESQFVKAELPGETPSEIRGAGDAQPPTDALPGLSAAEMNEEQKATLKNLLQAYTRKMRPLVAKARWDSIEKEGFDKIKFSWSGAKRPGIGHYYVVQGPTFLVEFINVQPDAAGNPANHVHCVWRDMQGDFGLPIANK
jgi:hypothetical protein